MYIYRHMAKSHVSDATPAHAKLVHKTICADKTEKAVCQARLIGAGPSIVGRAWYVCRSLVPTPLFFRFCLVTVKKAFLFGDGFFRRHQTKTKNSYTR